MRIHGCELGFSFCEFWVFMGIEILAHLGFLQLNYRETENFHIQLVNLGGLMLQF